MSGIKIVSYIPTVGFAPLAPGEYGGVIHDIRETTIQNGELAGKAALSVAVKMDVDGRLVWKILPMLTAAEFAEASPSSQKWCSMAFGSFMRSTGFAGEIPENFQVPVRVVIDFHKSVAGSADEQQNSIVLFKKHTN